VKRPVLLRVEDSPQTFAPLFSAAAAGGLRLGWLELNVPPGQPVPEDPASAADLGALRAVAVEEGRTVVIKPRRGPAVLEDLLREHFRGAAVVLVRGEVEAPRLTATEDGAWQVEMGKGKYRKDTASLLAWVTLPSFRMVV
jgi:hypothetical protein